MTTRTVTAQVRLPDHEKPALKLDTECPSCRRRPAVVFHAAHITGNRKDARLVCLSCCPKEPDHS